MGLYEIEKIPSSSVHMERAEAAGAAHGLLSDALNANPKFRTGQIDAIAFDNNWTKRADVHAPSFAGPTLDVFEDAKNSDVRIGFFYRGRRINENDANAFKNVLAKPPHQLEANELSAVASVLRDRSGPGFELTSAETCDVNQKRVLIVEGTFPELKEKTATMFIDADGSGSAVQEVYYQAPLTVYQEHFKSAMKSMGSIRWKR